MLEFLKATICFNLPPVRRCSRNDVCKCDKFSSLHNWWTTRGDSARPASSTGLSERGGTLFQKVFILNYYLYQGRPLPESLYPCLLFVLGTPSSISPLFFDYYYLVLGAPTFGKILSLKGLLLSFTCQQFHHPRRMILLFKPYQISSLAQEFPIDNYFMIT